MERSFSVGGHSALVQGLKKTKGTQGLTRGPLWFSPVAIHCKSPRCTETAASAQQSRCAPWHQAAFCPLQKTLTHKWPLNLLLYPIWLSHVASAFHRTAANTRAANPCLIVSAGIDAHCGSAWRLAAAWKSPRSLKDRGVKECVSRNPRPWPPWSSDHLMKAPEGVQSRSGAMHRRYLLPMLLCTFQEGRKTAQGNIDTVI